MSGIRASMGRTPSNIPQSTTVLRHSLFYTLLLHHMAFMSSFTFYTTWPSCPLHTTPPRFPGSTSAHHSGHIHPCAFLHPIVLFLLLNMPKPSQPFWFGHVGRERVNLPICCNRFSCCPRLGSTWNRKCLYNTFWTVSRSESTEPSQNCLFGRVHHPECVGNICTLLLLSFN